MKLRGKSEYGIHVRSAAIEKYSSMVDQTDYLSKAVSSGGLQMYHLAITRKATSTAFLVGMLFCSLIVLSPVSATPAGPSNLSVTEVAAWRQDLRHLAAELPRQHKDFYHRTGQAEFKAAVAALDAQIPSMARHQVIVAMARLVALGPDGHTGIRGLLHDSPARFRYLPIGMYQFKDGLFIYAAHPKYARAVGGRVVRIGKANVTDAIAAVAPLVPHDNEMAVKERAPLYLASPEVLHAVGLAENMESVPFVVEKNGKQFRLNVLPSPGPKPTRDNWALGQRFSKLEGWIDARSTGAQPLWLRDPTNYFWWSWQVDSRTLYVQYNEVSNKEQGTVRELADQIGSAIASQPVERLVLDLRWNTGGNNYLNKPLLLTLIKATKINQPGKLFAIIGRRNFSAVQNLVNDLDNYTNVLFVGEPTAGNPNFFGDPTSIMLPNSQLNIAASTLWWQDVDPRDRRKWTGPDLAVEPSFADYVAGRDPAFETILAYRPQAPLADRMFDAFEAGKSAEAAAMYEAFKGNPLNLYTETEGAINGLGYRLLGVGRKKDAVVVFALNVKSYSKSPNAYDSLAEAYLESGNRDLAIANYRKVLELDPGNANATQALRRIETGS